MNSTHNYIKRLLLNSQAVCGIPHAEFHFFYIIIKKMMPSINVYLDVSLNFA